MAGVAHDCSKFEVLAVLTFLLAVVSESGIHPGSVSVYGQKVFSRKGESVWCSIFKNGLTARNEDSEKNRADQGPRTLMKSVSWPKA
jgi:hypothetical protein